MVGPGGPTWPAGLGLCHLATDLLWMASDPSWTSVLRVSSSDSGILGRAAWSRGLSALRFTDIAHQRSTLPLDWVLSSFDALGTGRWDFGLILVPSGSTDRM